MIIDDPGYDEVISSLDVEVIEGGRLMINVAALDILNESVAIEVIEHKDEIDEKAYWAYANIIEMWRALFDTLTNKHAKEMVPDDLSGIDEENLEW